MAPNVQFTGNANRDRLQLIIKQVSCAVGYGCTDRHRTLAAPFSGFINNAADNRFRGAVFIEKQGIGRLLLPESDLISSQILATDDKGMRKPGGLLSRNLMTEQLQMGRGNLDQAEITIFDQRFAKRFRVILSSQQNDGLTANKGRIDGRDGGVEGDGGMHQ